MTKLLKHGQLSCRTCWKSQPNENRQTICGGKFQMINDPGAWGCSDPSVLILGISKGNTQQSAMAEHKSASSFDDVAFKGARQRLYQILSEVNLVQDGSDDLFRESSEQIGWGSLIRCSLTGLNTKTNTFSGDSNFVLGAFDQKESSSIVENCIQQHVATLTERTKLIILLGNSNDYIKKTNRMFKGMFSDFYADAKYRGVTFSANQKHFIHLAHPSPLNGHLKAFLSPSIKQWDQGWKKTVAQQAIHLIKQRYDIKL